MIDMIKIFKQKIEVNTKPKKNKIYWQVLYYTFINGSIKNIEKQISIMQVHTR